MGNRLTNNGLGRALTRLINMLPHNGLATTFSAAFVIGLGLAAGLSLAVWLLDNLPRVLFP